MTGNLQERTAAEIRAELARRQMAQARIAEALGRSEPYVSLRLSGVVPLNLADLERIAEFLDVPVSAFLPASGKAQAA